jgi:betaine-aldehyde dehydrogenase
MFERSLNVSREGPVASIQMTQPKTLNAITLRPAMLEPNSLDAPLVQKEVFAPVLSFETLSDEADALRRANATEFGLSAAVFSADRSRAHGVAQGLKAGTVWTNTWGVFDDMFPEGGYKQSGVGRARGPKALEEFQETKTQIELVTPLKP